jgi:hypothetical protein
MKKLIFAIKNGWKKIGGAAAIALIFLVPASRGILGQLIKPVSAEKRTPEKNSPRNNNQNPKNNHNAENNKDYSKDSETVKSVSTPSSRSTVSPVKSSGSSRKESSKPNNRPRTK